MIFCNLTTFSYAQPQSTNSNATSYSQLSQIDSSEFFVYGMLINKTVKPKYNLDRMYSAGGTFWTNVFIYNSSTRKSTKLFSQALTLVYPFYAGYFYNRDYDFGSQSNYTFSAMAKDILILLVRADNNNDGIIDEDDPLSMYLANRSGISLTQVTPKAMNLTSWKVAKDGKTVLVKLQKDTNLDKKFIDEDELLYQIDLNEDINKVRTTQIVP